MIQRGFTNKDMTRSLALECKALQDLVHKLRQEVLMCKDETQKVKDQLQCLIYLVRRAWSGDNIAAIHIANIVGISPPKFEKNNNEKQTSVSHKPNALNNWARLCAGVLNRMYHEEELDLRAAQLMYLQEREGYLDDELANHRDVMRHQNNMAVLQTNTFQLLQEREEKERKEKMEKKEQLEKQKSELHKKFKRQHPPHNHLYRKPSRDLVKPVTELNPEDSMSIQHVSKTRLHYHSHTADFIPKRRPKTATTGNVSRCVTSAKQRPVSAHLAKIDKPLTGPSKTQQQIDLIKRDLKLSTKALQDRLGISKEGMV